MDELIYQLFYITWIMIVLCSCFLKKKMDRMELLIEDIHMKTVSPSDVKKFRGK